MPNHTPSGKAVIKTVVLTPSQNERIQYYISIDRYRSESDFIRIAVQNYIAHVVKKHNPPSLPVFSTSNAIQFSDGSIKHLVIKESRKA
jgi:Arc/MetJ-type ribon-helix-helix transcriptional regulator